jgi:hypothetical protein
MRKPFDLLVEGLVLENSAEEQTPLELNRLVPGSLERFAAGVISLPITLRNLLRQLMSEPPRGAQPAG